MFERAVIESKVGFRALEDAELEVVSGGHINEDPIPSVFEDQLPSFGESIMPGIETWSLSANGGNSGDGYGATYGDNWILVTASSTSGSGDSGHQGSQASFDLDACAFAAGLQSVGNGWMATGAVLAGLGAFTPLLPDELVGVGVAAVGGGMYVTGLGVEYFSEC